MNDGKVAWNGNFTAVVTPFTQDGAIDEGKFVENLELLMSEGIDGLVVSGCTGEAWALDGEERLRLFGLAVEAAKGRVPVIAGTGGIITAKVTELSIAAKAAGVDGVMVLPPYYAMINEEEVLAHYRAVSSGAQAPILLYNIPRRTGINLTPELCRRLADVDYVVAIKESSNDFVQVEETLRAVGERIIVFTGHSAERGMAAVLVGCPGFVSSMETQVMGREAISLYRLSAGGDLDAARRVQMRTLALDKAMRGIGTFPANLKAAMNARGRPGGFVRAPLLDLNADQQATVGAILTDLELLEGAQDAA